MEVAALVFIGAIIAGLVRSIETASLHAAEFGVGIAAEGWLMLVSPMSGSGDWMAPAGGLAGMSGVVGGCAEALANAFPGADVHEPPDAKFPGEDAVAIVPVLLPLTVPRIATGMAGGRTDGVVVLEVIGAVIEPGMRLAPTAFIALTGLVETAVVVGFALITDGESSCVAGEQFTLVPGSVGSSDNGGEARVVTGAPGMVAAEKRLVNGLGPAKGDDTIAPGVVGSAIAVVPTVDIWADAALQPSQSVAVTYAKTRISIRPCVVMRLPARAAARPCCHLRDRPSG